MKFLLLAGLLALEVGAAQPPPPATLTLGPGEGVLLSPLALNGFNYGNWMPVVEARESLRAVRPTSLRFPGGNVGDENDLIAQAFVPLRANLGLLTVSAAPALIVQTRVFATKPDSANTPQDAANAAQSAREAGLQVAFWEIGNEPDLYAVTRGDPTWTPERYCATFRAQREAILRVDPQTKFAGPAVSGAVPARDAFLERFVRGCGDVLDLLTWHEYPTDGTRSDEDALASVASLEEHARSFRELLRDPARNPLGHARATLLGVTEYGLSYRSDRPRHLSDQVGALWAAEATLRLAEAGVHVANYFALQATGAHGLVDLAGVPRPTLYAFEQLRHFQGRALPLGVSDPDLWVHAAKDGDTLTLLVTNTATNPQALAPELPGFRLLGAKTFTAQTVEDEAPFIPLKLGKAVELPPRSLTRLAYRRLPSASSLLSPPSRTP